MRRRKMPLREAALGLFLALLIAPSPASGQVVPVPTEAVLQLDARMDVGIIHNAAGRGAAVSDIAVFTYTYRDLSIEREGGPTVGEADVHTFDVVGGYNNPQIDWLTNTEPDKWNVQFDAPTATSLRAGQGGTGLLTVTHQEDIKTKFIQGQFYVRLTSTRAGSEPDDDEPKNVTVPLQFAVWIVPVPFAEIKVNPPQTSEFAPDSLVDFSLAVSNGDLYGEIFRVEVEIQDSGEVNPSNTLVLGAGDFYVEGGQSRTIDLQIRTPRDKFWFYGSSGVATIKVTPSSGGGEKTTLFTFVVDGFYVSENYYLLILAFVGALFLLILLLIFYKRAYERKFLGKPIPPWEIPEERVQLEKLKQENPRAHYVLRYYTMVEEYRSALLWFYAHKKLSKRQLKREFRVLDYKERAQELAAAPAQRFDRKFQRIERRYQRRIDRRNAWLQRKIARLEEKLQRNYEKDYKKDHAKWEEKVEKLRKKQQKPFLKAKKAWQKEQEKALAKWEKPFKKDLRNHEKDLEKSKEAYAKRVKKVDRPTWRQWKEAIEDWKEENDLRKKEGQAPLPEPELFSAAAGDPGHPKPPELPPKPQGPPEPTQPPLRDVPPEPQLESPSLEASHYAKKARRYERKAARKIRKLERKMAEDLEKVNRRNRKNLRKVDAKRARFEAASRAATNPSLMDRVLRRTPRQLEARSRRAFLRALKRQRVREARKREASRVELARLRMQREVADLEAKIIREKAALRRASKLGTPEERATEMARIKNLELDLANLRQANRAEFAKERKQSAQRLEQAVAGVEREIKERLRQGGAETRAAEPSSGGAATEKVS